MHLLELKNFPILEQLKLEEALLRTDERSFCIVNEGSPSSIVMGISSKPEELLSIEQVQKRNIPVIRRFSGGGCVIVSAHTLFVSFIFAKDLLDLPSFPEPIHEWAEGFYQKALGVKDFCFRENDYVIAEKKCGGNAQYIKKDRWVHHTSFLWDYAQEDMDLLLFPKKVPSYRQGRSHDEFLCRLKETLPDKESFFHGVKKELKRRFEVKNFTLEEAKRIAEIPHRKSTTLLSF